MVGRMCYSFLGRVSSMCSFLPDGDLQRTLARQFDSVRSCGKAYGLVVVEVLEVLGSEAWVGAVFEVGHSRFSASFCLNREGFSLVD